MTTIEWLLDSDPSIRWQVMRDLLDEPAERVAVERSRIESEGWGARLLDLQEPEGTWGGAAYECPGWIYTTDNLLLLRDLGLDPASVRARQAVARVRSVAWGPDFGNAPYFEGEEEACINGRVLACGAYFGSASDGLVGRLLGEQLEDGGWNCYAPRSSRRSSFHSTICVLEGLLEYERGGGARDVAQARRLGEEYLLERRMLRSRSTGAIVDPDWMMFSYPTRWHYDVLWGLDYLRRAGVQPDERVTEAVELVKSKRRPDGLWLLENTHSGDVPFPMEDGDGKPSRWNTLRAMRVLAWHSA